MFWCCLPDSRSSLHHISRDFVPGYSRFARYCLPDSSYCALSPSALSPRSKSITDNPDATDLFFSRIFLFGLFFSLGFVCACRALGFSRIYLSLWTICGLLLLYAIQRRTGANTIRRKSKTK